MASQDSSKYGVKIEHLPRDVYTVQWQVDSGKHGFWFTDFAGMKEHLAQHNRDRDIGPAYRSILSQLNQYETTNHPVATRNEIGQLMFRQAEQPAKTASHPAAHAKADQAKREGQGAIKAPEPPKPNASDRTAAEPQRQTRMGAITESAQTTPRPNADRAAAGKPETADQPAKVASAARQDKNPPSERRTGLQRPTEEQKKMANEVAATQRLQWAKSQARTGNDPATGKPMVKVHDEPKGWDEKLAQGYVNAFALSVNLAMTLWEPLGWMGVGMTDEDIAEAGRVLTSQEINTAFETGTPLPERAPPPAQDLSGGMYGEFDPVAGTTPSPELARVLEQLQDQGVRLQGNFVSVAPHETYYVQVEESGGAWAQGSTIYVNMDILIADRYLPDPVLGVALTERQTLLHEMGHLGEDKNLIDRSKDASLFMAKHFANEAEASRKAALMAVDPEDQQALIRHSIAALKETAKYLGR